jgi:hypothetical protein
MYGDFLIKRRKTTCNLPLVNSLEFNIIEKQCMLFSAKHKVIPLQISILENIKLNQIADYECSFLIIRQLKKTTNAISKKIASDYVLPLFRKRETV